jgi:hypothetical protein
MDRGRAVVTAWGDDGNRGAAYVYEFDGMSWVERARLTASDGEPGDFFGHAGAISGDVVLVGARGDDENGESSGSAYFFRYDGSAWVEEAKVLASNGAAGHDFGTAVAIDGSVAIIGAHGWNNPDIQGYAYIFRYNGAQWIEEAKLIPSHGSPGDLFGFRVSISGSVAIVTSGLEDGIGAVYVYRYNGASWEEEQRLVPQNAQPGDDFGTNIDICGGLLISSAHADYGSESGSAYIYRYDPSKPEWVEEAELVPSDGSPLDEFGNGVAIRGNLAVVGAPMADDNGSGSGKAYVFHLRDGSWKEHRQIVPEDGDEMDLFGSWTAIWGDDVIIGAPGDDKNGGEFAGSAYVYWLNSDFCCPFDINRDGKVDVEDLLLLLANWGACP